MNILRVPFEDNSFLELECLENGSIRLIICGIKGYNQATVSSVELDSDQYTQIMDFIKNKLEE